MNSNAKAVCLIKPQFEAGKDKVGKKGVVRDYRVHVEVIEKIKNFALDNGFNVLGVDYSPIKGPEGNIEYLIYLENSKDFQRGICKNIDGIDKLVKRSHCDLNGGI